eukprot:GHUV01045909.1.p1 GENE.GHUV01045909.1~~GHUV01045909.1.p1  ORF type:complete len:346 (+),score=74.22 GHUV01045909.1:367-1404(+)
MVQVSVQPCGLRAGARPFVSSIRTPSMGTRVNRSHLLAKCSSGATGAPAMAVARLAACGNRLAWLYSTVVVDCLLGLLIGSCMHIAVADAPHEDANVVSNRRQALLAAASAIVLPSVTSSFLQLSAAAPADAADAQTGFKALEDATLAYKFMYPTQTASGQPVNLVLTRPPEKYSSAAPLSADARQRICSELFDLKRFVTVSMTVGPASGVLRDKPQEQWTPREVALTVLVDRSTARLSSGQRTALNDVEESHKEERDGQVYYVYEHTSQGSPTISSLKPETYRHALAVTTTRPGLDGAPYLYTLNVSCPQSLWDDLAGPFKTAVDSFQLVPTTRSYIAPDQNPW